MFCALSVNASFAREWPHNCKIYVLVFVFFKLSYNIKNTLAEQTWQHDLKVIIREKQKVISSLVVSTGYHNCKCSQRNLS